MSKTGAKRRRGRPAPWRPLRSLIGLASAAAIALAVLLIGMWATGAPLHLPAALVARIEARLKAAEPAVDIALDGVSFGIDRAGIPRLTVRGVRLGPRGGEELLRLDRVGAAFSLPGLLRGAAVPSLLRLEGLSLTARRDAQGRLALGFGPRSRAMGDPAQLLDMLDALLGAPPFSALERIEIASSRITLEDARAGRDWVLDGTAELRNLQEGLSLHLDLAASDGARVEGMLRTGASDSSAALSVDIKGVPARDLALQSPALAALGLLQAPISGRLDAALGPQGEPGALSARLEIGPGALKPGGTLDPVPFEALTATARFDPAARRIALQDMELRAPSLGARMSGQAYLREPNAAGIPEVFLAQLDLSDLRLERPELFDGPVRLDRGIADLRLRLDPFEVTLGQLVVFTGAAEDPVRLDVKGRAAASPEGWHAALDLEAARLDRQTLDAFWPAPVAAKTRVWLQKYLHGGVIENVTAALRLAPGAPPRSAANFTFRDAEVTFLNQMPPITKGAGYGAFSSGRFVLKLEEGTVQPEIGGPLDLSGTSMTVPDIRQKPATGAFDVAAKGTLTGLLSLLNRPPLNVLRASGRAPDLAEAEIDARAQVSLLLRKGNTPADIDYTAEAQLAEVSSSSIVKGRSLTAKSLAVQADRTALVISGDAAIDGIPTTFRWRQPMGPGERDTSRVSGSVTLSPAALRSFGVALPEGMVGGAGPARYVLDLQRGAAPRLTLESTLEGLTLSVPALGWRKGARQTGTLSLEARLGPAPKVERIAIAAAGLDASGQITAAPGGGLGEARFDSLRVGTWLDAAVRLTGQGRGTPPAIAITGGRMDAREAPMGRQGSTGSASASKPAHGPISVSLDTLRLTDGIALAPFTARIAGGRSLDGTLTGRVNGGAPVSGTLISTPKGTALRVTAANGGAVLRDAGISERVHDGQMELRLQPTGAAGSYDGRLTVRGPRVRGAPALADLLAAISVVGLLEQLNGRGIVFEEAQADFGLSPGKVTLYSSSAVGASLGISMDGVYDLTRKSMDMQGVVSPIYLLNSIGSIFTRRGEGLFGVSFTLAGPVSAPQVSANPLSLFTPGMFREIFRRPPPQRN